MSDTARHLRANPPWVALGVLSILVLIAHLLTLMTVGLHSARPAQERLPKVLAHAQLLPSQTAPAPPLPPRRKRPVHPTPSSLETSTSAPAEAPAAAATAAETASAPIAPPSAPASETTTDAPDVLIARQLPPPALLTYELEGMDRGLHYRANSTLQWQFNDHRYDLSLTVQAFLLGSRQWRSTGQLGPNGLLPERLSDKRKSEVAAHFDRTSQHVIFSSNKPTAPLLAGAQDQISLFVQLGGAVNTMPDRFAPGTTLNVQTVTSRSADLWHITLVSEDKLLILGQTHTTRHWVCAPRGPYDSRLEFWTDPVLTGLPVRIRITQVNGSYIDMQLSDLKDAPPLPAS